VLNHVLLIALPPTLKIATASES